MVVTIFLKTTCIFNWLYKKKSKIEQKFPYLNSPWSVIA